MRTLLTILLLCVALAGTSLMASAQLAAGDDAEAIKDMSISQMRQAAQRTIQRMERQLSDSFSLLEQAITLGDVATSSARSEALTALKALVKLSNQNYIALQQKVVEKDRAGVEHEYVKISIAAAKCDELFAQVKSAGGSGGDFESQNVETLVEIDVALPPVGTVDIMSDVTEIPEPPVYASPYF